MASSDPADMSLPKAPPRAGFSFYWHDYETFGKNPRWAGPAQFAGVRTDSELNIIGDPLVLYCQPSRDILPDPEACLVTGITPQQCLEKGLTECEFAKKIVAEFSVPGTCGVGYNSIRFDDEFTRHLLYRNFYDPYEREWKNGNSRWDLLDVLRLMHALRPEGLVWPRSEAEEDRGRPIFKLTALTEANSLQHEAAHDALSDVLATIALAKKVREAQPKLFDYALSLRDKKKVAEYIDLSSHKPLFHVSSRLQWQHGYAALMMPLCKHPSNANGVVCVDLSADPLPLIRLSSDEIAERVFSRREELPAGAERIPLKTIHLNKSPMVASLAVLDDNAAQRLQIDRASCEHHWQALLRALPAVCEKVVDVMQRDTWQDVVAVPDPEFMLYQGFLDNRDRHLCDQVRQSTPAELARRSFPFADRRLGELLFRYRARNFPDTLSEDELHDWEEFRFQRLHEKICEDAYDLESYQHKISALQAAPGLGDRERQVLQQLQDWADQVL